MSGKGKQGQYLITGLTYDLKSSIIIFFLVTLLCCSFASTAQRANYKAPLETSMCNVKRSLTLM
jgi:hypothetical protein